MSNVGMSHGPSPIWACHVPHLLLDTGALKTTEGKAEGPSLDKEGWLRPLKKCREASLAGADGHERSECEPDRAKQGKVVRSSHRLSEVERTTPAAPFKGRGHLLDGAATPPLPRRGVRQHPRRQVCTRDLPVARVTVRQIFLASY